jgi:hypothetical protein
MKTSKLFLAATAAFLLGAGAAAQGPARVLGTVELLPSGFVLRELEDRGIATDSLLDLTDLILEPADLTGSFYTSPIDGSLRFEVASAAEAQALFEAEFAVEVDDELGVPPVGILELGVEVLGEANFFVFASFDRGVVPLLAYAPDVEGTFWLDPSYILTLDGGAMVDAWGVALEVPMDPVFAGLELHLQAAVHTVDNPVLFLNAQSVVLWP